MALYILTPVFFTKYPSWLYEVNLGATTIWERWNSLNPDGTVSDTGMNSMNHYTYGAIVEWMFRVMAGLNNCETKPGFKRAYIKPVIDHHFSFVQASYLSASGLYKSSWHKNGQHLVHKFSIPFDTEAFFIIDDKYELVSINNIPANKIPKTESGILLPPGEYECVATLIKA